jgi:hypothetical protein
LAQFSVLDALGQRIGLMSDDQTETAPAKAPEQQEAGEVTTAVACPEVVELAPNETPGIAEDPLAERTRQTRESIRRTLEAAKRLDEALSRPVFR